MQSLVPVAKAAASTPKPGRLRFSGGVLTWPGRLPTLPELAKTQSVRQTGRPGAVLGVGRDRWARRLDAAGQAVPPYLDRRTKLPTKSAKLGHRRFSGMVAILAGTAGLFVQTACTEHKEKLVFNQAIAPILSDNCYQCHGPDPGARKAGLRLDRGGLVLHSPPAKKGGPAIVKGDPDDSVVIQRIETADPKLIMPPPEAHKTLKPGDAALLRRWIKEGAEYQEHWAFIPPRRPPVPATARADWARNPIDSFILSRLEQEGLSPSPEADRPALIRRVTYDLTGLPPTPQEVEAFVRDPSPEAYERVVDRLLANPAYGEHRAHYWLDAVRYGDTHGLHLDDFRSVWPYRDYVIKSFNENKPFDRFTREQLAGDLLPPDNVDQIVASAFIRLGISTGEGGSIPEEVRVANQRERAEAFGAVYLGLTTGCAVCHDHKFDPTTQKDFYQLTAFFNNLTELAIDRSVTPDFKVFTPWAPFIKVPKPEKRAAYDALLAQRAGIQRQINSRRRRARELIAAWLDRERLPRFPCRPQDSPYDSAAMMEKAPYYSTQLPGPPPGILPPPGPHRAGANSSTSGHRFAWTPPAELSFRKSEMWKRTRHFRSAPG